MKEWSQDDSVGIAIGYGLDGQGSIPSRARLFPSPQLSDEVWGPPSFLSSGYWGEISPGVKQQGHEADHSLLSSSEVKKGGVIPPFLHMSSWHSA
jgi:hypothetical protein